MKKIIKAAFFSMIFMIFSEVPYITCGAVSSVKENDISAKACILIEDAAGRVLFEKNADERLPMASTTKIMSALLLLENGDLDTEFTVDSDAIKVEGSSMGLREGDIVTARALCAGMLLPSGNDAANASAVHVAGSITEFARLMNLRAASIGMKNTHFVTPSGLHDDEHYSTARDMALLASEALRNPDFAEICGKSVMKLHFGAPPYDRWLRNTNKLLTMYDGCIGVKTGFTDEAGRCLVSACERDGVRLICVTLNDRSDWDDHIRLYNDGFSRITSVSADVGIFTESIVGGEYESISVTAEKELFYPSADGYMPEISYKAVIPPFVYAPVSEGDIVGRIELYADGKKFSECSLISGDSVEISASENASEGKKGIFSDIADRIIEFIRKIL